MFVTDKMPIKRGHIFAKNINIPNSFQFIVVSIQNQMSVTKHRIFSNSAISMFIIGLYINQILLNFLNKGFKKLSTNTIYNMFPNQEYLLTEEP